MFVIPISLLYKEVKQTLRLRPIRSCKVYIPAISNINPDYQVSLEDNDDLGVKYTVEGAIVNVEIGEYSFSIIPNLPNDVANLPYKELRRMFYIVKLDLVDDNTIAPEVFHGVYVYFKM